MPYPVVDPVTTINIYPYPLTNLKIKDDFSSAKYWSYTSAGDHYVSEEISSAGDSVTISADGYVTQNVSLEFGTMTITLQSSKTYMSELSDGTNIYTIKDAEARTALSGKQDTLVSGTNIKTVGGSSLLGSGNISIPVVNNATLTIQKNGTTVNTFTANASSDVTANITVPTKTSDLTNDNGFITGISSSDVTTALGYTPYNSTNPSGYQANVIETVKVNGTALTPSSKAVDVTVPTKVSQLTNDSGYTSNTGTVTSVNSVNPVNGNVTLSIPTTTSSVTSGSTAALTSGGAYTALSNKQDTLVSGTNIKTINNTSILGSGNINISSGTTYTAGDGIDITNNVISVDGQTTNTVTLATVATTGAFSDLSGTSGVQTTANLVTSVSSSSTDSQYPSAKLFYDTVGDIETLLDLIIAQSVTRNTLTFNLTGDVEGLRVLTVNGTDYTSSNFTNNSLTLTFAQGTSITWSVTKHQYYGVSPSSGSLTLNSDTNITITLTLVE